MKRKINHKKIMLIVFVLSTLILVRGGIKHSTVSTLYDEDINDIVNSQANHMQLLQTEENISNFYETRYLILSGKPPEKEISIKKEGMLTVQADAGKIRIVVLNKEDSSIIVDEKIEDENKSIQLDEGEYNLLIVGKYFSGKLSKEID